MGKFYDEIPDEKIVDFIRDQKLFHVASAPLNGGHVNVSPRAYRSFKLVNSKACWFMDLSGSGNETISHLYEPGNGRITIMFEAFEGPPNIVRLYGKGTVYERDTPEFNKFFESPDEDDMYNFPTPELLPGARAVIRIDITRVSTSCGYSVPFMQFLREREQLAKENTRLEANDAAVEDPYTLPPTRGLKKFWVLGNTWSIDGLPGLKNNIDKADPEGQRMVMRTFGLKDLEPPSAAHVAGLVKTRTTQTSGEVFMLLVGALLGAFAMIVAQRRLS